MNKRESVSSLRKWQASRALDGPFQVPSYEEFALIVQAIEADAAISAMGEVQVKPLEWGGHPDGEAFYALENDGGDALYCVDLMPIGLWRLYIGEALVMSDDDPDATRLWDGSEDAKAYAQGDFDERVRRVSSALTHAPVSVEQAAKDILCALGNKYDPKNPHWADIIDTLEKEAAGTSRVRGSDGILITLRVLAGETA